MNRCLVRNFYLSALSSNLFPHQNDVAYDSVARHLHKRSPELVTLTKLTKLSALKGLVLAKALGLGLAKKKKAYKTIKVPKKWVTLPGR